MIQSIELTATPPEREKKQQVKYRYDRTTEEMSTKLRKKKFTSALAEENYSKNMNPIFKKSPKWPLYPTRKAKIKKHWHPVLSRIWSNYLIEPSSIAGDSVR